MISAKTASRIELSSALLAIRRQLLQLRDSYPADMGCDDIDHAARIVDRVVNTIMEVPQ